MFFLRLGEWCFRPASDDRGGGGQAWLEMDVELVMKGGEMREK